jgi:hypothetical protein
MWQVILVDMGQQPISADSLNLLTTQGVFTEDTAY